MTLKSLSKARRLMDAAYKALTALDSRVQGNGRRLLGAIEYEDGAEVNTGVYTAGVNSETYGATVLRELIASAGTLFAPKEDPVALVKALAEARNVGLPEVELELRRKLGLPAALPELSVPTEQQMASIEPHVAQPLDSAPAAHDDPAEGRLGDSQDLSYGGF